MNDRTRQRILWGVSGLLGVGFLLAGVSKFLQPEAAAESFMHFELPPGLVPLIAICEIAGGIGILVPRLAGFAALGLTIIMIGAVYSHLTHDPPQDAIGALVMGVLSAWVVQQRGLRLESGPRN